MLTVNAAVPLRHTGSQPRPLGRLVVYVGRTSCRASPASVVTTTVATVGCVFAKKVAAADQQIADTTGEQQQAGGRERASEA
jgi:hypothetical protein